MRYELRAAPYLSDEVKSMWIFLKKGSFMRPENVELPSQRYLEINVVFYCRCELI